VTAKLITYALVGAGYAVLGILVQLAITLPWLAGKHIDLHLRGDVGHAMAGLVLAFALFAIMSVGVGALLRNQALAITLGLVFLLVINNLIAAIPTVRTVYPYTPAGAMIAVVYPPDSNSDPQGITQLSTPGGVIVLLLWALLPAEIGAARTLNRDIT
jgi:ABC-type transport system involved in multi-copper enzyme maturation permease subunit